MLHGVSVEDTVVEVEAGNENFTVLWLRAVARVEVNVGSDRAIDEKICRKRANGAATEGALDGYCECANTVGHDFKTANLGVGEEIEKQLSLAGIALDN